MLAVNFEGAREIGKPKNMTDEECSGLPIFQAVMDKKEDPPGFAFAGFAHTEILDGPQYPFTLSAWKPSKEDLEALNRGEPIWVRILSHVVFPMSLFTLDAAGEINQ